MGKWIVVLVGAGLGAGILAANMTTGAMREWPDAMKPAITPPATQPLDEPEDPGYAVQIIPPRAGERYGPDRGYDGYAQDEDAYPGGDAYARGEQGYIVDEDGYAYAMRAPRSRDRYADDDYPPYARAPYPGADEDDPRAGPQGDDDRALYGPRGRPGPRRGDGRSEAYGYRDPRMMQGQDQDQTLAGRAPYGPARPSAGGSAANVAGSARQAPASGRATPDAASDAAARARAAAEDVEAAERAAGAGSG